MSDQQKSKKRKSVRPAKRTDDDEVEDKKRKVKTGDNENKHEEKSVSSKSSKKNLGESADLMAAIAALTDMHKVIANLIQSNEALVQQLKEVETNLRSENDKLRKDHELLRKEFDKLAYDYGKLKDSYDRRRKDADQLRKDRDNYSKQLDSVREQLKEAKEQAHTYKQELETLRKKLNARPGSHSVLTRATTTNSASPPPTTPPHSESRTILMGIIGKKPAEARSPSTETLPTSPRSSDIKSKRFSLSMSTPLRRLQPPSPQNSEKNLDAMESVQVAKANLGLEPEKTPTKTLSINESKQESSVELAGNKDANLEKDTQPPSQTVKESDQAEKSSIDSTSSDSESQDDTKMRHSSMESQLSTSDDASSEILKPGTKHKAKKATRKESERESEEALA